VGVEGTDLNSPQDEVRRATARLPERQREALELREHDQLSYEEIAARIGISIGSVAQLIARARINLYDELRGTPLASIAAPPECERALPLIAAREDGQLDVCSGDDASWLDAHLVACDRCRAAAEQMTEARASYRGKAALPLADDGAAPSPAEPGRFTLRRRRVALVVGMLAVLLLTGLAAAVVRDGGTRAATDPAGEIAAPGRGGGESSRRKKTTDADAKNGNAKQQKPELASKGVKTSAGQTTAGEAAPTSVVESSPPSEGGGAPSEQESGPDRSSEKTAVDSPKQIATPMPSAKPKPAPSSAPASQPASAPAVEAPAPEAQPVTEEPLDTPGRSGEAPGKPDDRPSRK
jgi:hypothetical protein